MKKLLDLFCCQGGASLGYVAAGFEVEGVDMVHQKRYPFTFHRGDANAWPLDGYDAVHASPPCRDHTSLASLHGSDGTGWMLSHTIDRLEAWGRPFIVENVPNASRAMPDATMLCGSEFDLGVNDRHGVYRVLRRHRLFTSNVPISRPGKCRCQGVPTGGVYGHGGGRGDYGKGFKFTVNEGREAMQMPWACGYGISQAVPPAYTKWLGKQLMEYC